MEQFRSFGVLSIAVDPERRGLGIGRSIMNLGEKEARAKGFLQLNLTVHLNNSEAISFYEHCGWKKLLDNSGNWTGSMIKPLSPHSNGSK